ncbi:MAG: cation:proton antiporter, partial [bacterium]|nr:cation:proton antiporter [bacterium]
IALAAAWLGHLAGLSFEFGAFVAGAVTSEAAGGRMVQTIVAPFRELFVMLFFVAVGMLFDVAAVARHWQAVLLLGACIATVRLIGWGALGRAMRWGRGTALAFGIAMLPVGEFNIVLANAAHAAHRLDQGETALFIGVAFASILLAAVLARFAKVSTGAPESRVAAGVGFRDPPAVLVIGYGRVGRTTAAILRQAGVSLGVIEIERDLVRLALEEGVQAIHGSGSDPRLLDQLLSTQTKLVVTTIPDSRINAAITRRVCALTQARVIARAGLRRDVAEIRSAGAMLALVPEAEGALAFADAALGELGVDHGIIGELIARARAALPQRG